MNKKLVVIPSNGHIIPLGGILGPVVEPHVQPLDTISVLLMQNYKVSEVLNDGTHLPLNLKNFDKDNNAVVEEKAPVAPPKGEDKPEEEGLGSVDVNKQQQEDKPQQQQQNQQKQHHDKKKNKGLQADQTQPK